MLGFRAGPLDRLVQAHDGLLAMDFSEPFAEDAVERLDPTLLPPLFAYHELFTVEHFHAATVTGKTPAIPQTLPAFDAMLAVRASLAGALTDWRLGLKAELIRRINQQIPIQVRNDNLRTYNDLLRDLRAAIDDADAGLRRTLKKLRAAKSCDW